ncbi:unnamed protein product [Mortierella alpina]
MAKANLQARDDALFPVMEKALEFLTGDRQVLLMLGDSDAAKPTFSLELEHILWKDYKYNGPIPLYINFLYIDNPAKELIAKQSQYFNFTRNRFSTTTSAFLLATDTTRASSPSISTESTDWTSRISGVPR